MPDRKFCSLCYDVAMLDAKQSVDRYFLEMRWRCLSLAADLDRVERSPNAPAILGSDPRLARLQQAMRILIEGKGNRAEQVEKLFSDASPPPPR
jgi:hypothetical protein